MFTRRQIKTLEPRSGATLVEMAITLPVFVVFLFGLFEFAHAYMISNALSAACKKAARLGVVDGITTDEVTAKMEELLQPTLRNYNATIYVKDASVFDTSGVDASNVNYGSLPDLELADAEPRQLFIVRVEVPYNSVAIFPPKWITNVTLTGQSVMRHE